MDEEDDRIDSNDSTDETQGAEGTDETQGTEDIDKTQPTEADHETQGTEDIDKPQTTEADHETQSTEVIDETQPTEADHETQSTEVIDETQPTEAARETESAEDIEEYIAPDLKACTFTVGGEEFSIELSYLKEIAELSEVVPLPLSPPYIEGITHLRGAAIPVVNIAVLRDIHEEWTATRWLIVLEIENDYLGIAVNKMPYLSTDYMGEIIDIHEFLETHRVR